MEPSSANTSRSLRVPGIVWAALAIVVAGAAAVRVLGVPSDQAILYGLIALMVVAHFGMHAGHGAHGAHAHKTDAGGAHAHKTDADDADSYRTDADVVPDGAQEAEDRPGGCCH